MLHWLWVFIIGLVVGIIAKWIMPGRTPVGFIVTAIIGIVGSFIGGLIARWIFNAGSGATAAGAGVGGFWGLVLSIIGAVIALWIYRALARPRPGP